MNTKTAYLATPNRAISDWLESLFGIKTIQDYQAAELLVFPGGLDVNPSLYNEPVGQRTSYSKKIDNNWTSLYRDAAGRKKILGICKGSHFLTAMSSGNIFQHTTGHILTDTHNILVEGVSYPVNSTHHQIMNPFILDAEDYEILAYSEEMLSNCYLNGYDDCVDAPPKEVEAIFYKGNGSLAIQFHPEFLDLKHPIQSVVKKWMADMFNYNLEDVFDKYITKRRKGISGDKSPEASGEINIPESIYDEFIKAYLK
jgi:GMP synthase-like glutamine amidotransferase